LLARKGRGVARLLHLQPSAHLPEFPPILVSTLLLARQLSLRAQQSRFSQAGLVGEAAEVLTHVAQLLVTAAFLLATFTATRRTSSSLVRLVGCGVD